MIEGLQGNLISVGEGQLLVEVGGISLSLQAPSGVCEAMRRLLSTPGGSPEVRLFTHLRVLPDSWQLYGFQDEAQRRIFRVLLGIPGIGPRLAMSLLSHLSWQEICAAIEAGDHACFQAVPGIGKRTAARIVVELAGKVESGGGVPELPAAGSAAADAVDTLAALGLGRAESLRLIRRVVAEGVPAETTAALVTAALERRK
ncbi:MAG: Holliday junction branch migration protein RuvA [Candidatus Eisenbacteria sp.]|nr:Holliday junction branch migration protein RuvA [Candidatus Eisenbacteria bacterium]